MLLRQHLTSRPLHVTDKMSAPQAHDTGTIKAKKSAFNPPATANPGRSGPTTFFLRSEREMEAAMQRGRRISRSSAASAEEQTRPSPGTVMESSSFGVESLADTINSAYTDNSLSRTDSAGTESAVEASTQAGAANTRKRKAGNPVHPKIIATGQRLFSGDHISAQASSAASPASYRSSESLSRMHVRRGSTASSVNLNSQPLTPLRMSPHPVSGLPSTPRSGSPKSFRLSDEENSVVDETGSQVIQSSNGEEEDDAFTNEAGKGSLMPQLVMPSIAMPARRPFTERGRRMGRLKVLVAGPAGIGKTSLIHSICRMCEDIVHVDTSNSGSVSSMPLMPLHGITATFASTRPYPTWWTDIDGSGQLCRRKSISDGVLERNICFIDSPGADDEVNCKRILDFYHGTLRRIAHFDSMGDGEIVSLLSGDGGHAQIDAVLWLFDASLTSAEQLDASQRQLLDDLCSFTNVIPIIARADAYDLNELDVAKTRLNGILDELAPATYSFVDDRADDQQPPFAVSSASIDDPEVIDASLLMSSGYMQPLAPSELQLLVASLFEPENIRRMRHLAATKFLLWRQQHLGAHMDLPKQTLLHSPQFGRTLRSQTSTGSLLDEPSKVLVPQSTSSYYRSASPSLSDASVPAGGQTASSHALAHYNQQTQGTVPFRQIRLAKWAQDLQRSLDNERKRYRDLYFARPSAWSSSDSAKAEDDNEKALIHTDLDRPGAPARGRLGGDIAIIDPRDPLGLLAFSHAMRRRGWLALQVAGGCGLVGAVAWWVMRNWAEVQEWFGRAQQPVSLVSTPAPTPAAGGGLMGFLTEWNWRGFLGWDR